MRTIHSETDLSVYRKYSRPIVHLRQQLRRRRMGLVLGAGISQSLGFPGWDSLVDRIISDTRTALPPDFASKLQHLPATTRIQVAFEAFKAKQRSQATGKKSAHDSEKTDEISIRTDWRRIVRDALYRDSVLKADNFREFPLLVSLAELSAAKIDLVVNYNFDDSLERAIQYVHQNVRQNSESGRGQSSLGYQTIWSISTQQDPDNPTIYHPNGFISSRAQDLQSDTIVFSDEEFSDQHLQSLSGEFSSLIHFFSQNTCLFAGLSLRDTNLRYLLRQSRQLAPGNIHYLIFREGEEKRSSEDVVDGVFRAQLSVHNLYTMFLSDDEILALLRVDCYADLGLSRCT
jgi:hypothetical protein